MLYAQSQSSLHSSLCYTTLQQCQKNACIVAAAGLTSVFAVDPTTAILQRFALGQLKQGKQPVSCTGLATYHGKL